MNQTNSIHSNLILNLTFEEYLNLIGDYETIDVLYYYLISTLCMIGSILNLICIWIFFQKDFKQSLFTYYRILSINSFLHEFIGFWFSLCYSNRYIPFNYQYLCVNYQFVFVPLHMFFHFYSGLIEIAILLDRIKIFVEKIKNCVQVGAKKIMLILFFISALLAVPGIFINEPKLNIWYSYEYNQTVLKEYKMYNLGPNESTLNSNSLILIGLCAFISNLTILILTVVLSSALVHLIRKHFKKMIENARNIQTTSSQTQSNSARQKEKLNRKASLMAIVLNLIMIVSRVSIVIGLISFNINVNFTSKFLLALGDLFIFIDSGSLLIVCLCFNKIFKSHFFQFIKLRKYYNNSSIQ
jgi:hypothetical protein